MVYLFVCDTCQEEFEVVQKINDSHDFTCPNCGISSRRKYTPTPFKFDFKYGYDSGLGAYCDTKQDKERIMQEKNLIEQ